MSEIAPSDVVEMLDTDAKTEKRASWEAFEFTVLGNGDIAVVNGSYDNPDEHRYTVHVENGIPSDCTCPAWEYQSGACKHMVAVAIREPLLEAVAAAPAMRADGGVTVETHDSDDSDARPDDCDCAPCLGTLPCWPCYRDGFEGPNPNTTEKDE